ncbi:MAG: adenylyl-sulfate kinase [Solirubrobacteraceae bacterium]
MSRADQFEVELRWQADQALVPGRRYLLSLPGTSVSVGARVAVPKYRVAGDGGGERLATRTLGHDQRGVAVLTTEVPIDAADGERLPFSLLDAGTGAVAATGEIAFALRRSRNLHWQEVAIDKAARTALGAHRPAVVWFTGLSGAGKSSIANEVERRLHAEGARTYLLDGDNVRQGLNKDLGFTEPDRIENMRRISEVARLMADAGLIVLVAFISPFREERARARALLDPGEFCEVFVDTPLEVAEARDVKGLYAKARRGELKNFTGIDSPYEPPLDPEVRIEASVLTPGDAAGLVIARLRSIGVLSAH